MSWIDIVSENQASGDLKAVYEQVSAERGKLSNIMRVHSLNPPTMKAHMDLYLSIMFGRSRIRRADRELIAGVVSRANECAYCVSHHNEALNAYWKDEDRVRRVVVDGDWSELTEAQRAMLDYAVKLTRTPGEVGEEDIEQLRAAGLDDRDILDVNLVASYFNFVNRIALGLGVEFDPEEMSGYNY